MQIHSRMRCAYKRPASRVSQLCVIKQAHALVLRRRLVIHRVLL